MNDSILLTFASHPFTEFMAMLFSLLYIFLAAKGNIWCWLAGFFCTFFYTFIFIYHKIDSQVILNVIYMILSVVGWMIWLKPLAAKQTSLFTHWPALLHLQYFVTSIVVALLIRYILPFWFDESFAVIESWLFCASLMATILTIYRVLESWLYWIVIDIISLGIYWQSQENSILLLYFTSLLLAIYGYSNWNKYRKQDMQQAAEKDEKAVTT